jgi:hypothetical protein
MSNQGNPTPIPWAGPFIARGSISNLAQEIAGRKSFLDGVVSPFLRALPVSSSLSLIGTNGTGSTDVVVKVGTPIADASVHTGTKLFRAVTGLGGTEVEKFSVNKGGDIRNASGMFYGSATTPTYVHASDALGAHLVFNTDTYVKAGNTTISVRADSYVELITQFLFRNGGPFTLYAAGTSGITETVRAMNTRADANLKSFVAGTEVDAPNANAILLQAAYGMRVAYTDVANGTPVFRVYASGALEGKKWRWDEAGNLGTSGSVTFNRSLVDLGISGFPTQIIGTNQGFLIDTTAAVGGTAKLFTYRTFGDNKSWVTGRGTYGSFSSLATAATGSTTVNNAKGRVNIPSGGAGSYTITNDQVTVDSVVAITWESVPIAGSDGLYANWAVTVANGSFSIAFYDTNGGTTDLQQPATFRFTVHQ